MHTAESPVCGAETPARGPEPCPVRDADGAPVLYRLSHRGVVCDIEDAPGSRAVVGIVEEIGRGEYDVPEVDSMLDAGAVMVDVGAHVGCVSILYAMLHPTLKVHAIEPFQDNYDRLVRNIRRNGLSDRIEASKMAVTKDGRAFTMIRSQDNTGGATGCVADLDRPGHVKETVPSTTLDELLSYHSEPVALLKMDCEGAEHEILAGSKLLPKVSFLVGELHENDHLRSQGYSMADTRQRLVALGIPHRFVECAMANI